MSLYYGRFQLSLVWRYGVNNAGFWIGPSKTWASSIGSRRNAQS